jgi:hypothetical protein
MIIASSFDRIIYWKPEEKERIWRPIPDKARDRQTAIKNGAMFFTSTSFSGLIKGDGNPEPWRWGDLLLDFDSGDIGLAWEDIRTLCTIHLRELYNLDPYVIRYYLSGGRGFHAIIPARLFGAQNTDQLYCEKQTVQNF